MRDNQDMRRISAWVAILAVPTMVVRALRHELRAHARARLDLRLSGGDRPRPRRLRRCSIASSSTAAGSEHGPGLDRRRRHTRTVRSPSIITTHSMHKLALRHDAETWRTSATLTSRSCAADACYCSRATAAAPWLHTGHVGAHQGARRFHDTSRRRARGGRAWMGWPRTPQHGQEHADGRVERGSRRPAGAACILGVSPADGGRRRTCTSATASPQASLPVARRTDRTRPRSTPIIDDQAFACRCSCTTGAWPGVVGSARPEDGSRSGACE